MKIASFIPAGTSIIYELGLQDHLIGVTFECQYPKEAKLLPKVIQCVFDSNSLSSSVIDKTVSEMKSNNQPLYTINESILESVDIILLQDLCDVCAIGPSTVLPIIEKLKLKPKVVYLTARSLEGLYVDIHAIADACNVSENGHILVNNMKSRVEKVANAVKDCIPIRTICIEWLDPIYNAGHWLPGILGIAGGYDPMAAPEAFSVALNWEKVVELNPEVIILMPCGFDLNRTLKESSELLPFKQDWNNILAVQNENVYAVNGNRLFSGASPALIDGIEVLASILHPNLYKIHCNAVSDMHTNNDDYRCLFD